MSDTLRAALTEALEAAFDARERHGDAVEAVATGGFPGVADALIAHPAMAAIADKVALADGFADAFRRNHGERGHPLPFAECNREVCLLGRHYLGDES